jgi:hypothetical protein
VRRTAAQGDWENGVFYESLRKPIWFESAQGDWENGVFYESLRKPIWFE